MTAVVVRDVATADAVTSAVAAVTAGATAAAKAVASRARKPARASSARRAASGPQPVGEVAREQTSRDNRHREGGEDQRAVPDALLVEMQHDEARERGVAERRECQRGSRRKRLARPQCPTHHLMLAERLSGAGEARGDRRRDHRGEDGEGPDELVAPGAEEQLPDVAQYGTVCGVSRQQEGILVRLLSAAKPPLPCAPARPDLEDVYLFHFGEGAAL